MARSKPVRLLLTITADKMPEWHACLQSIDSGYVRAEMVRKGLKRIKPNQIQLMNEVIASDALSPTEDEDSSMDVSHHVSPRQQIPDEEKPAARIQQPQVDQFAEQNAHPAKNDPAPTVDIVEYADKSTEMTTATKEARADATAGVAPAAESQGGMAARMIQSGLGGNWGSG